MSHFNVTNSMSHLNLTKSISHLQHTSTRYDVSQHITYHTRMSRTQWVTAVTRSQLVICSTQSQDTTYHNISHITYQCHELSESPQSHRSIGHLQRTIIRYDVSQHVTYHTWHITYHICRILWSCAADCICSTQLDDLCDGVVQIVPAAHNHRIRRSTKYHNVSHRFTYHTRLITNWMSHLYLNQVNLTNSMSPLYPTNSIPRTQSHELNESPLSQWAPAYRGRYL